MQRRCKVSDGLFAVPENKNTCRQCEHAQRWGFAEHDKKFYYCGVRTSGRTQNGLLKIKLKNQACGMFKKEVEGE